MFKMLQLIDAIDMASIRAAMKRKKIMYNRRQRYLHNSYKQHKSILNCYHAQDQDKRQTNKGGGCPSRKRKSWLPPGSCYGGSVARNVSFLGACMMTCYFVIAVSM